MYKASTWGARYLPGIQKGCKASTKQPKGVQGMYKAAKWGARHVRWLKARLQGIYKGCKTSARQP